MVTWAGRESESQGGIEKHELGRKWKPVLRVWILFQTAAELWGQLGVHTGISEFYREKRVNHIRHLTSLLMDRCLGSRSGQARHCKNSTNSDIWRELYSYKGFYIMPPPTKKKTTLWDKTHSFYFLSEETNSSQRDLPRVLELELRDAGIQTHLSPNSNLFPLQWN